MPIPVMPKVIAKVNPRGMFARYVDNSNPRHERS
jgi:hypothetical protein